MNVSAPMSKVRAVSPNCVRPIQKVVTSTPLPYQPSPRGQVLNSIRPTMQQHQQHMTSPISVPGKIRIRAPVVQAIGRTAPTNMRPTIPPNFTVRRISLFSSFINIFRDCLFICFRRCIPNSKHRRVFHELWLTITLRL